MHLPQAYRSLLFRVLIGALGLLPLISLLIWSVESSFDVSRSVADQIENIARLLKYLGILATAVFTGWSILTDTVDRSRGKPELTARGRLCVILLYLSVLLTAASAVLQDKADDRVRFWERKEGNKEVGDAFSQKMQELKPDLERQRQALAEQTASIQKTRQALAEQTASIQKTTGSIQDSGKMMAQMLVRTGRDLEFTSHRFKDLTIGLSVEGARGIVFFPPSAEKYTNLGEQLKQDRDRECRSPDWSKPADKQTCTAARDALDRWSASTKLRSYLDPTGQLSLTFTMNFVGFNLEGSMTYCPMFTGQLSDAEECFEFSLSPNGDGEEVDLSFTSAYDPLSGNHFLLKFADKDGFQSAFSEDGIPGRDASFGVLSVEGCDQESSNSRLAARRASRLRSNVKFVVSVTGLDEQTSRDISNLYQLREYFRSPSDTCVATFYTYAPEVLVPRLPSAGPPS